MERKILAEITHNTRVTVYPDGTRVYHVAAAPIYRERGWEAESPQMRIPGERSGQSEDLERARRRAAAAVSDLALSNDFNYFVTLTLDRQTVDRYDMAAVLRRLNRWLDNRVRRNGLCYVLVPERHKDGAIHFHGFFNDACRLVSSGTFSVPGSAKPRRPRSEKQRAAWLEAGAHEVYNILDYPLGFSTAITIYGDRRQAVGYVCKYVTKQHEKIGGRWYYSGGDLRRPHYDFLDADFSEVAAAHAGDKYRIDRIGVDVVSFTVRGDSGEVVATDRLF